jgi:hypothetical protein
LQELVLRHLRFQCHQSNSVAQQLHVRPSASALVEVNKHSDSVCDELCSDATMILRFIHNPGLESMSKLHPRKLPLSNGPQDITRIGHFRPSHWPQPRQRVLELPRKRIYRAPLHIGVVARTILKHMNAFGCNQNTTDHGTIRGSELLPLQGLFELSTGAGGGCRCLRIPWLSPNHKVPSAGGTFR